MQLPPLLCPAVVLGIACYPRSRAGPSARRGCAARRAAGAAGWHPAAAAGRQHAAARALLPCHLSPVVLHRRDDGEREIQGAAPATTAAAEEHRTPLTEGLHVRVSLRQCWAAIGERKIRDYPVFRFSVG